MDVELFSDEPKENKKEYAKPVLMTLSMPNINGAATNRIAESTNGHGPIVSGS